MTTLAKRIAECLEESGKTPAALAAYCGIKAPSVHDWLNGKTKNLVGMNLNRTAEIFNVNPEWLHSGKLPKRANKKKTLRAGANESIKYDGIRASPPPRAPVPVVSLIKAGAMINQECLSELDNVTRWETPDEKLGVRGWAHVVEGDSMDDGTEASISEGWLIFVDPDITPEHNHFVIAKDAITHATTFKKLIFVDGKWYLKPLNRHYQPKEIDSPELRVIGVVTEARAPSRKLL